LDTSGVLNRINRKKNDKGNKAADDVLSSIADKKNQEARKKSIESERTQR
jgi:hypothetical protein